MVKINVLPERYEIVLSNFTVVCRADEIRELRDKLDIFIKERETE